MFEDVDSKCPFFRKATKDRIRCDGVIKNSATEIAFSRKMQAEKYKCKYCDTFDYKECDYYKMIAARYDRS